MNKPKPGWKTSEFWLSLGAATLSFVYASGVLDTSLTQWDNRLVGVLAGALAALGYTVSRTIVKRG